MDLSRRTNHRLGRAAAVTLACACAGTLVPAAQAGSRRIRLKVEHVKSVSATVLAAPSGLTLYRLRPETSRHLLCVSRACLAVWPPLTVASKGTPVNLPRGVKGKIGFLRRGGRFQLTLGGVPLYRFAFDDRPRQANGQHIHSFGGVWSVLLVRRGRAVRPPPASGSPGY